MIEKAFCKLKEIIKICGTEHAINHTGKVIKTPINLRRRKIVYRRSNIFATFPRRKTLAYMRNPWRICIVTIRYNTFHQLASSVSVGLRFGLVRNYECIVYSLLCEHVG